MKCTHCDNEIPKGNKFCTTCGKPAAIKCASCGYSCSAKDSFCGNCGANLLNDKSTQSAVAPVIQPTHVIGEFEGMRKHISILFADIKGSTALIEGLDPEEARSLTIPVVQEMLNAVYLYDGTIIHTAGDGILAIFGAPQPLEDHALRACLAALTMRKKIKELNEAIKIRVGINTGEVLIEVIADPQHREYDIIGPVVNIAARMEQTAEPDTIQITSETYKLIEKNITTSSYKQILVKGFKKPIGVFTLGHVKATQKILGSKSQHTFTPFVGREKEMLMLKSLLLKTKEGKSKVAGVVGEAGIGKSRLIVEFTHANEVKDCYLFRLGGFSHTQDINLYPIMMFFRDLMGIKENDSALEINNKISFFIQDVSLPYALNAVLALLQLPIKDPAWNNFVPQLKRRYVFNVVRKILINLAAEKPIIFLIEDLHWIDNETESFLSSLISKITDEKIFILMTYRPGYDDTWLKKLNYVSIHLTSLSKQCSEIILDALLGNDFSLMDIKAKLLNEYSGNPFFLEEMIKNLIDEKILVGEMKHYQFNTALFVERLKLPESIFAVLQTKMDKLPLTLKKILQVASVIGQTFSYNLLVKLVDENQRDLRQQLNSLYEEQFIYETQLFPELEFAFHHALIQEVAYNSLLKNQRKSLHLKILPILEKTADSMSQLQIIANHAFLGEDWTKAFEYCSKAAESAFALNAIRSSVQLYNRGLIAAENIPKNAEIIKKCISLHIKCYLLFIRLGQFSEQENHFNKAMELAVNINDEVFKSILYAQKSILHLNLNTTSAIELAAKADKLAKTQSSQEAIQISKIAFMLSYFYAGQFTKFYAVTKSILNDISDYEKFPEYYRVPIGHLASYLLFWALIYTGDLSKIKDKESWLNSQKSNQPSPGRFFVETAQGLDCYFKGQLDQAADYLTDALNCATEIEMMVVIPTFAAILGCNYLYLNKITEGKTYIYQAISLTKTTNFYFMSPLALDAMCEGLLLLSEYENAKQLCDEGMKIVIARNLDAQKASLLRVSALIDLHLPTPDFIAIKAKLESALQLAIKLNLLPHIAHCHFVFAKLYQQMGRDKSSSQALTIALKTYEKLEMTYWTKQCQLLFADMKHKKKQEQT